MIALLLLYYTCTTVSAVQSVAHSIQKARRGFLARILLPHCFEFPLCFSWQPRSSNPETLCFRRYKDLISYNSSAELRRFKNYLANNDLINGFNSRSGPNPTDLATYGHTVYRRAPGPGRRLGVLPRMRRTLFATASANVPRCCGSQWAERSGAAVHCHRLGPRGEQLL